MDRLLLSGNVRKELKELFTICPVAPDDTDVASVELHHPLRDGRPPLPLSKKGHSIVEGLLVLKPDDADGVALVNFRKTGKQPISWKRLRVGCLNLSGIEPEGFKKTYLSGARSWVRKAMKETSLTEDRILAFLDRYDLGSLEE